MSMSFWKNKPIAVKFAKTNTQPITSNIIVPADTLLQNTVQEIENSRIQLDWVLITNPTDDQKYEMLEFINQNYGNARSYLMLQYNKALLDYFIKPDTLCITFYPKGKALNDIDHTQMIGLIMGKKHDLFVREGSMEQRSECKQDENEVVWEDQDTKDQDTKDQDLVTSEQAEFKKYNCIDVNFLCLVQHLRNLHVSSYMINVVTRECLVHYNLTVPCAVYTVNKRLNTDSFCKKTFYHRPVNVENMLLSGMMTLDNSAGYTDTESLQLLRRIYNTFSYSRDFFKTHTLEILPTDFDDLTLDTIYEKLFTYNRNYHDIFEYKSKDDLRQMLQNPTFYKFIIRDEKHEITDFFCLYNLNTINKRSGKICRNGNVYSFFLQTASNTRLSCILEAITEVCYQNNTFDVITIMNIFNTKPELYKTYKLLRTDTDLYYYVYNMDMYSIPPHRNGLITI